MELADRFTLRFAMTRIMPGEYRPELSKPDGPSTLGGVQAMQHIRLVSKQAGLPPLHAGTCNQKEGTAELRSFEYLAAHHLARFKQALPLSKPDYDAFLVEAGKFFTEAKLTTTMATHAPVEAPTAALSAAANSAGNEEETPAGPLGGLPPQVLYAGIGLAVGLLLVLGFIALR